MIHTFVILMLIDYVGSETLDRSMISTPRMRLPSDQIERNETRHFPICDWDNTIRKQCAIYNKANRVMQKYYKDSQSVRAMGYLDASAIPTQNTYNVNINVHAMPKWWLGDVSDMRCPIDCKMVTQKDVKTDIIMHYLNVPKYLYDYSSKHALVSLEGCYGDSCQNDPDNLKRTDILLSFDPRADFFTLYNNNAPVNMVQSKIEATKLGSRIRSALHISNCHKFRIHVIERLIDSGFEFFNYGSCHIPRVKKVYSKCTQERYACKVIEMRRYDVAVVIENTILRHYITEKFYNGLNSGTLMVYLGSLDLSMYRTYSFVNMADFTSPGSLYREVRRRMHLNVPALPKRDKYAIFRRERDAETKICGACLAYVEKFGKPDIS
eukprot:gene600-1008_t